MKTFFSATFLFFILGLSHAQQNRMAYIDSMVRNINSNDNYMISSVCEVIKEFAKTDLEKSRAVYTWLATYISYDDESYNTKNYPDQSPENVMFKRKAVCAGTAYLFNALAKGVGLKSQVVSGYAKGYGYEEGSEFTEANHAWNRVLINGVWKHFDATWGEGYGFKNKKGKLQSVKKFDDGWFDVSDWEIIYSHYPELPQQLNINPQVTKAQFEAMPYIVPRSFYAKNTTGKKLYMDFVKSGEWNFTR